MNNTFGSLTQSLTQTYRMRSRFILKQDPYKAVGFVILLLVVVSTLTRIVLLAKSASGFDFTFSNLLGIFSIGLFYDLINSFYFVIPLMLYIWLVPSKKWHTTWNRIVLTAIVFIMIFLLLFNAVSEWVFWDEFGSRFNFIAVDYLVYTNEVVGNIQQSYPIGIIVSILTISAIAVLWIWLRVNRTANDHSIRFKNRTFWMLGYIGVLVIVFFLIDNKIRQFSTNTYANELAGNGIYELFAAYRNNELDYDQFYERIPEKEAFANIRSTIKTPESQFVNDDPQSIERLIKASGVEMKKNVVLISVESLSADFLGVFGNEQGITPNLDSLAAKSLLFTNLYATGTRTVRGLEALSVATPPTPGQSIVRRPHNEGLFTIGSVFKEKGYATKFIYGGYGYFDNMGYYFANNGYTVVDRTKLTKKEIDYENIWGVADENLFTLAKREIEESVKSGKPVFAHVMTTSNHRPFTYPDGRIDIPSHTSREGAVKYTDYAIGKFLKDAEKEPWFKNTMFVIIADHCASSAGKTDLPVNKYKIPLLIYAPGMIAPAKMDRLMSQIDLAPTILGLLNFSYKSKFFGYDIFKLEPGRERAFISTYQSLGYIRKDTLIILKPQRKVGYFKPNFSDGSATEVGENQRLSKEAITWYQTASYQFKNGLLKAKD